MRPGRVRPGKFPPRAHVPHGLKEINFDVQGDTAIIGPRKFKGSNFFNLPVTRIHEMGGTVIGVSLRRRVTAKYPERSYMYAAVQSLTRKGKIQSTFNVTLERNL